MRWSSGSSRPLRHRLPRRARRSVVEGRMTPAELLTDAFGRIHQSAERRPRRPDRRAADRPAGSGRQHDRLAGLAPRPGRGRPRRRGRRARAGVDRGRLLRPVRPALRRRRDRLRAVDRGGRPGPRVLPRCSASTTRAVHAAHLDVPHAASPPRTSTASSTSAGTRRSPSASVWSASLNDATQHVGQAAYATGLVTR